MFISNNICAKDYAKSVECPVYIIGSTGDNVLNYSLQEKLSRYFKNSVIKQFHDIGHEEYFNSDKVIGYILQTLG